jgi:hypothetical protein
MLRENSFTQPFYQSIIAFEMQLPTYARWCYQKLERKWLETKTIHAIELLEELSNKMRSIQACDQVRKSVVGLLHKVLANEPSMKKCMIPLVR